MHDGRDGVEECKRVFARLGEDRFRETVGCEGAGGDDDAGPVLRRPAVDFAAFDRDERVRLEGGGDIRREVVAIDREG